MISTYRQALAVPGAPAFTLAGFVARLPLALNGLGIVLLVSITTGSYALAGALSAVYALVAAIGGILSSRWADVHGQRPILRVFPLISGIAMVGFVTSIMGPLPQWAAWPLVAVTAATQPTIGSYVRARWAATAPSPQIRRAGFAWESIVDEFIFAVAPLVAATTAVSLWTPTPLVLSAVLLFVGCTWLARQHRTEPPTHPRESHRSGSSAITQPGVLLCVAVGAGLGTLFGAFDVATVAFTREAGWPGAAGIVLGLWAGGSFVGGLYFGSRRWSIGLASQLRGTAALLSVVIVPAIFVNSVPWLAVVAFVAGMTIAPTLISLFSVTERLVPPRLLTEGLTWVNAGLATGFAAGSALGGIVIDAFGTHMAFALAWVGALISATCALVGASTVRTHLRSEEPEPAVAWVDDPIPGAGGAPTPTDARDRLAP